MTTTDDHQSGQRLGLASTEGLGLDPEGGLLARLQSLKVLLGTDSPEVRGWAPIVQQGAQATVNAAIVAVKAMTAARPDERMTRFCPACGSIGFVPDQYRDCCPDGGKARVIPESMARNCRDLFYLALSAPSNPDD